MPDFDLSQYFTVFGDFLDESTPTKETSDATSPSLPAVPTPEKGTPPQRIKFEHVFKHINAPGSISGAETKKKNAPRNDGSTGGDTDSDESDAPGITET